MSGRSPPRVVRHSFVLSALSATLACPVVAEPLARSGTYGLHRANDLFHVGYAGRTWPRDYGVRSGACDTAAVPGTVAGAAAGSRSDSASIGVITGATIGAVIGATIGRELDRTDRACIGHALELAPLGHVVTWTSNTTRVHYALTPVRDIDRRCRQFRLVGRRGGQNEVTTQVACSNGDGRWQLR
jgi:surface antigen